MATLKTIQQLTSISTACTKKGYNVRITTVASTLAAGASAEFTFNNAFIEEHSLITFSTMYAGTNTGCPVVNLVSQEDGSCVFRIHNADAAALDAAISINVHVDNSAN